MVDNIDGDDDFEDLEDVGEFVVDDPVAEIEEVVVEFDENDFDEDFDDDFEEEVEGEYTLEYDKYGEEFRAEFGHLEVQDKEFPDKNVTDNPKPDGKEKKK